MKLGVIISVYNGMDFLEECLQDWISLKHIGIEIAVVDCLFENFNGQTPNSNDGTVELLEKYLKEKKIDFFQKLKPNLKESEARNVGIEYLLNKDVTHVLTTAPDEIFSKKDIKYLFDFLQKDEENALYYLNYKNYIGNKKNYILGFCPKRIWTAQYHSFLFNGLRFDDDGMFYDVYTKNILKDDMFPSIVIPDLQIKHYSWLDGQTSKKKIEYQRSRGWTCSYKVDDQNRVSFNEEFYKQNPNIQIPKIYTDES
jgi:glycosyltransferase involved in cell wall biosynthesis